MAQSGGSAFPQQTRQRQVPLGPMQQRSFQQQQQPMGYGQPAAPSPGMFPPQQAPRQPVNSPAFAGQRMNAPSQQFFPSPQNFQQVPQQTPLYDPMPRQQSFGSNSGVPPPQQQHPAARMGAQPSRQPDFIDQLSSNPMAGLAMNTAQDFLNKQSANFIPGAKGIWGSIKYYFNVNNTYVVKRLQMTLAPFWHRDWRRIGTTGSDDQMKSQYAPPSRDINAPDLYLPLMGFLTYILIVGYAKGTSNQFSPDVIVKDASYCLVLQVIEIGIMAGCMYLLNSSVSPLDLLAFSGYKYIALVVDTVVYQLLGSIPYYIVLLYTGVAVSYFTLNCMKGSVADPTPENRAFRNYLLFGVSLLQLVLVSWISFKTLPA